MSNPIEARVRQDHRYDMMCIGGLPYHKVLWRTVPPVDVSFVLSADFMETRERGGDPELEPTPTSGKDADVRHDEAGVRATARKLKIRNHKTAPVDELVNKIAAILVETPGEEAE